MKATVEYIKDGEAYAYDNFIEGATISDIVKELTYNANRYGVDYDEIAIFILTMKKRQRFIMK
jgi:hypothetical protein